MSKKSKSKKEKMLKFVRLYPNEFIISQTNDLWCVLCNKDVSFSRKSSVQSHRNSNTHENQLISSTPINSPFVKLSKWHFPTELVKCFLETDIALHKLRNDCFQNLFNNFDLPLVTQSSAQQKIKNIANEKFEKIKQILTNEKIFFIVDESCKAGLKYTNILMGKLSNPNQTYLVRTVGTEESVNSEMMARVIDETFKSLDISRNDVCLFISDAARYMIKTGTYLKIFYSPVIHITCLSHLLHNVCLKLRLGFPNVDNLISTVKAATVKNSSRSRLFDEIGVPPQPVLTRWGTWLSAAKYYSSNFQAVKNIVNSFQGEGKLVTAAKECLGKECLRDQLEELVCCYGVLIDEIENFQNKNYCVESGYRTIMNIHFKHDPLKMKKYIEDRMKYET